MVVTTVLEFIIDFVLESFFHDKWWDYSQNPFNIKGYVCLEFSLIWGFACVLVIDVIHPLIARLVALIPNRADGERTGSYFKRIISAADHRKKTQKSEKTKKSGGKREV